jgi:hypothetical protein
VQKFEDELQRRFIVVVKDDLAVAGISLNITHWKICPRLNWHRFGAVWAD